MIREQRSKTRVLDPEFINPHTQQQTAAPAVLLMSHCCGTGPDRTILDLEPETGRTQTLIKANQVSAGSKDAAADKSVIIDSL